MKNVAASVRARLVHLAQQRHETADLVFTRYALERFLYRLGQSPYAGQFVLKGAMLFALWANDFRRATRDIDLLGLGSNDEAWLKQVFNAIISLTVEDDGLVFLPNSLQATAIREDQRYGGQRLVMKAQLGSAILTVQVDIGFGDAITPAPLWIEYPSLLAQAKSKIQAYPVATVVAEKLHAITVLGIGNSRLKDYYDLWVIAKNFPPTKAEVHDAIVNTFLRRQTSIPNTLPLGLSAVFSEDNNKQAQWKALLKRNGLPTDQPTLAEVIAAIVTSFEWPSLG
jgi:hypothetical protein